MLELPEKLQPQIGHHLAFFGDEGLSMSESNSVAGKAGDILCETFSGGAE